MDAFDIPGRIKCGTIACPDLGASVADYVGGLGFAVATSGTVVPDLAAAWGAPALAGRGLVVLQAAGGQPCFVRLVETPPCPGYRPLQSFGWAAFEFSVADCFALHERLAGSAFSVIGAPRRVAGFDNFIPFQVIGRAGEVLYLNQVLQPEMAGLDLPPATAAVDAIFIAVLAAPDLAAALDFHLRLGFEAGETWSFPVGVINASFGLPADTPTTLTMTRTGRLPGSEIDAYPSAATSRPLPPGSLPPGNAMVSFIIASLDTIAAPLLAPPARHPGPPYAGRRSATVIGAAGERIELIEAA